MNRPDKNGTILIMGVHESVRLYRQATTEEQDEEIFHSKRNDYAYRSIGECEREDRDSEPGSERRRRRQGDRIPNCKTTFRRIPVGLDWRHGHIVDVEVNGKGSCS